MSSKLSWFKHYNTASEGNSLRQLYDSHDYEAIAFWWKLLEWVSRWEKPESRGKVELTWGILKRELGWNRQRSTKVLSKIALTFKVEVEAISDQSFQVLIPNWLELQKTRGGKQLPKNEQTSGEERREKREPATQSPREEREKKEEEIFIPSASRRAPGGAASESASGASPRELVARIEKATGRSFPASLADLALVRKSLEAGISPEDMVDVARLKAHCWKNDTRMKPFIRLATFFNPEKVYGYLGEVYEARKHELKLIEVHGSLNMVANG